MDSVGCLALLEHIPGVSLGGCVVSCTFCSVYVFPVEKDALGSFLLSVPFVSATLDATPLGLGTIDQNKPNQNTFASLSYFTRAFYHSNRNVTDTSTFQRILWILNTCIHSKSHCRAIGIVLSREGLQQPQRSLSSLNPLSPLQRWTETKTMHGEQL